MIRSLERLRSASLPIANVSTVRSLPESALPEAFQGIWIQEGGRNLHVRSGRTPVARSVAAANSNDSDGYLILLPDASWVAPIAAYLKSSTVRNWLDHHAERKGERWVLNEQVVRWIPIPKCLLTELGQYTGERDRADISPEWMRMLSEAGETGKNSQALRARIKQLPADDSSLVVRASLFVRAAQMLDNLETSKKNLLSLVGTTGRLAWVELFDILPKSEFVQITLHPRLTISGNLPLHLPISRIERVKAPQAGILLATEVGMFVQLSSDRSVVLDMLWEQLENVRHPTWSELVQSLRLPRKIEMAQATAEDLLRSHAEVSSRIQALSELLSDCSIF